MNATHTLSDDASFLWVPQPVWRGTFGIFSLCVNTMVISVWSAVHFDIPTYRPGMFRSFVTSVVWMAEALFCPELLLFIAFNQRANAKGVLNDAATYLHTPKEPEKPGILERIFGSKTDERKPEDLEKTKQSPWHQRRHAFTLVHGFYAAMGGFVFDMTSEDGQEEDPAFLPQGRTRMTITSAGIRFLMRYHPDLIPNLSELSITDRTRASSLSKAVLLAQITWFCTNCIARIVQGLPLSLLEVTTVAHSLCTLVTYMLWWSKPLNVAEPTLIRGQEAREACALMTMCSPDEMHVLFGTASFQYPAEMGSVTTLPTDLQRQSSIPSSPSLLSTRDQIHTASEQIDAEDAVLLPSNDFVSLIPEQQCLNGTTFTPRIGLCQTPYHDLKVAVLYRRGHVPWHARRQTAAEHVVLHAEDVNRWRLAYAASKRYGLSPQDLELPDRPYVSPTSGLQTSSDYKGRGIRPIVRSNLFATALTAIYGLPHFLGWNASFPTAFERQLWRVATLAVTFWGMGMASIVALIVACRLLLGNFTGERRGEAFLVTSAAIPYIATAGFLLVESLRQLLYLQPASYDLPSWSNYWPHFS